MTVTEYREKHPHCEYCDNRIPPFDICLATNKKISKRQAKKCPCYKAQPWKYDEPVEAVTKGEG